MCVGVGVCGGGEQVHGSSAVGAAERNLLPLLCCRFKTEVSGRDVVAGFQLTWRDGVTEETRGTGARELPPVRRRWHDRRQASPFSVLASMARAFVLNGQADQAVDLGDRWTAAVAEVARLDFGVDSHTKPANRFGSLGTAQRALLLQAWQLFVCAPSGLLDRALPVAMSGLHDSPAPTIVIPFTQEWLLVRLMTLLTPGKCEELNFTALCCEARGVSPVSIACATLKAWQQALLGGHATVGEPPFLLTSGDCLRALRSSLSASDASVTEDLVRTMFEAFKYVADKSAASRGMEAASAAGAGSGVVGGPAGAPTGPRHGTSTLSLCREALVELLSDCRANGTPLPFLDGVDAREFVGVVAKCVVAGMATSAHVLPLLQDLMSSVNSRKAHLRANWVGAILSDFKAGTEDATAAHNEFLLAACNTSLADGCEPAWRLWRRELLSQLAGLDVGQPYAVAPQIRAVVDCIAAVGTPPDIVRVLERVLKEEPKAVNPSVMLSALFDFAAARLGSPHAPGGVGPPSPAKLFRRASGLTREETYTSGRSSVFTKCLVTLLLGFMRQNEVQFTDCFLDPALRLDVFETVAANMLHCELFPGDFKEMVRGLSRIAHLWAAKDPRFEVFVRAPHNVAEQQLRRLLGQLFSELEGGSLDLFGSGERLQALVDLLAAIPGSSAVGHLLRGCLQPHVGAVIHLLGSPQFQGPAVALLPELVPFLKLSATDRTRLATLYSGGRSGSSGATPSPGETSHDATLRSIMESLVELGDAEAADVRPSVIEHRRKELVQKCKELGERAAKCGEDMRVAELAAEDEAVSAIQRAGSSARRGGPGAGPAGGSSPPESDTVSTASLLRHQRLELGTRVFDFQPGEAAGCARAPCVRVPHPCCRARPWQPSIVRGCL